jgi:hypothetical protein
MKNLLSTLEEDGIVGIRNVGFRHIHDSEPGFHLVHAK